MGDSVFEQICDAAYVEYELKKKNKKKWREINENPLFKLWTTRYIVSLAEEPVAIEHFQNKDPNIKATNGDYALCYVPMSGRTRDANFPFVIKTDLLAFSLKVKDALHWHNVCRRIPECGWMLRNTTYEDGLFAVAKKHPGMYIRFTVKWVEYMNKIENRAKELGVDIDNKAFVAYKMSKQRFDTDFKDKEFAEVRGKAEYIKELDELYSRVDKEE